MDKVFLSNKIKELRNENDLSIGYIADICHVNDVTVQSWEDGEVVPSLSSLGILSRFYHIPFEELIEPKEDRVNKRNIIMLAIDLLLIVSLMSLYSGYNKGTDMLSIFSIGYSYRNLIFLFSIFISCVNLFIDISYITSVVRNRRYYFRIKIVMIIYMIISTIHSIGYVSDGVEMSLIIMSLIILGVSVGLLSDVIAELLFKYNGIKNMQYKRRRLASLFAIIYLVYAIFQLVMDDPIRDSQFVFIAALVSLFMAIQYVFIKESMFDNRLKATLYVSVPSFLVLLSILASLVQYFNFGNLLIFIIITVIFSLPALYMNHDLLKQELEKRKDLM